MFLSNPVSDLQPSTNSRMVQQAISLLSTFIVLLKVVGQISGLEEFDYYLIKLGNSPYSSAELEMSYYELATMAGVNMMPFSSNSYNT